MVVIVIILTALSTAFGAMFRPLHSQAAQAAAATAAVPVVRLGTVDAPARPVLEAAWTDSVGQVERAFCVRFFIAGRNGYRLGDDATLRTDSVFRVLLIEPASVRDATPNSATVACPQGQPVLHVHPPTTCWNGPIDASGARCMLGGPSAYQCQPSRPDYEFLIKRGDPFAVVQCDKRSFRFYYPADYRAGGAS